MKLPAHSILLQIEEVYVCVLELEDVNRVSTGLYER